MLNLVFACVSKILNLGYIQISPRGIIRGKFLY